MVKIKNKEYNVKNLICVSYATSEKNQKSYTILEFIKEEKKFIEVKDQNEHDEIINTIKNYLEKN